MYDLGSRIKDARKRRGLSQKVLAQRINKCPSAISGYESNSQVPPIDVLKSLALTLNVSIDYLAGLDEQSTVLSGALTEEQNQILELLLSEFAAPTNGHGELSARQMTILQKLILLFSG